VTLRFKILCYLTSIHLLVGAVAVIALREHRSWLLAAEALFLLSIAIGWMLVRAFFQPLELIRTGAQLLRDGDFTTRIREVGQPEMDPLIDVYNRMIDRLREERQRLAEQHVLLDKILRASPSGILTFDFDGRAVLANPAAGRLLRATADGLLGRRLDELDLPLASQLAALTVDGSTVLPGPGGRRLRARRVGFVDRGFSRSFVLVEELTHELRASEKEAYGTVIRMLSHEVRNTVGAVRSLLDSCRGYAEPLAPDDRRDFVRAIEVSSRRLESLDGFMNGFADVVRLPDPDPRPCDLRASIEDLLVLHAPELARRRIAIEWTSGEDAPLTVVADKNQLEQVIVNVLRNAIDAIGEDGLVAIEAVERADGVALRIADDGPGLSDEARANLFTPFFTTRPEGRGLGLTVVREILDRHGFEFDLANRVGRGAEFSVRFTR